MRGGVEVSILYCFHTPTALGEPGVRVGFQRYPGLRPRAEAVRWLDAPSTRASVIPSLSASADALFPSRAFEMLDVISSPSILLDYVRYKCMLEIRLFSFRFRDAAGEILTAEILIRIVYIVSKKASAHSLANRLFRASITSA